MDAGMVVDLQRGHCSSRVRVSHSGQMRLPSWEFMDKAQEVARRRGARNIPAEEERRLHGGRKARPKRLKLMGCGHGVNAGLDRRWENYPSDKRSFQKQITHCAGISHLHPCGIVERGNWNPTLGAMAA